MNSDLKRELRNFLKGRFSLEEDNATQAEVVENIKKSVEFRGQNLWILMFAIVIASVGLNVNSAAVIIGAMLVSPLMGPIMGFGLSLGIYDFELLKRSLRNFLFAVGVSLAVSTLYFMISPLSVAQSEIIARTTPTIWDVLIAFFGGLAGIVAQTRKDRTSTVIPGVAIATALMPPLCTAGYGLGTLQFDYFAGAIYLFTINAVLISIATYIIVRFLNYEKKQQVDVYLERKVQRYIYAVIFITVVPSCILAYNMVQNIIFQSNSVRFVENTFKAFADSQVVDIKITNKRKDKSIEVLLIGKPISSDGLHIIESHMKSYKIEDAKLIVKQQGTSDVDINSKTLQSLYESSSKIIEEKNKTIEELSSIVDRISKDTIASKEIAREFSALSSSNTTISLSKTPLYDRNANIIDTAVICIVSIPKDSPKMKEEDVKKITEWLKVRTNNSNVKIIIE